MYNSVSIKCTFNINFNLSALAKQGGSVQESDYPYQAVQGQCSTYSSKIVVKVTGGRILNISDEDALKDALYNYGPLSVCK